MKSPTPQHQPTATAAPSASEPNRRGFLQRTAAVSLASMLGQAVPFARLLPAGLLPVGLPAQGNVLAAAGKEELVLLNDRPLNAETPAHLLDATVTPAARLFVRNNGIPPAQVDANNWTLTIAGESCKKPQRFTLAQLQKQFTQHSYQLQIECGGNGRSEYSPPASGNQWSTGAVGCPRWTGVRLADVLRHCGIADDAVYVGYYGADKHPSGDTSKVPISRGVPMHKALEDETLIAWAMNDEPLPALHGFPLRLVCGGWPASTSGKWLTKLVVRNKVHDGAKMLGSSYRVPCAPVAPGTEVPDAQMCIIESMPVKSLITYPESGIRHPLGKPLELRGHAWAGDSAVAKLFVSIDFGSTWQAATVQAPANRLSWQRWTARVDFAQAGYYEVWARAVDDRGRSQPTVVPGWNPKGYLNNAAHRIAVSVRQA